jgi:hypothetical protein
MTCNNCRYGYCSTRVVTIALENKKWSASDMAASRQKLIMEEKNVFMRELTTPDKHTSTNDAIVSAGSANNPTGTNNNDTPNA